MFNCRIAILALLLFCSCEYAAPSQQTKNGGNAKLSDDTSTPKLNAKPGYVVSEPNPLADLTGINGGRRFSFDPPEFTGEWTLANESDVVRFFVLDLDGLENVSVPAENFYVRASDNILFSLDPDYTDSSSGSCSYSLEDRNLALAMNSPVEVVMTLQGKSYRASLNAAKESVSSQQSTVDE